MTRSTAWNLSSKHIVQIILTHLPLPSIVRATSNLKSPSAYLVLRCLDDSLFDLDQCRETKHCTDLLLAAYKVDFLFFHQCPLSADESIIPVLDSQGFVEAKFPKIRLSIDLMTNWWILHRTLKDVIELQKIFKISQILLVSIHSISHNINLKIKKSIWNFGKGNLFYK